MTTIAPVVAAMPSRTAAPLPALRGRRMSCTPSTAAARSGVPSVDPSSTTMTSLRKGTVLSRRRTSSMVAASL